MASIDPPYNRHLDLRNDHTRESLVCWDRPEVYGWTCKRVDCLERRSALNVRSRFGAAMEQLIASVRAPVLIVSASDESWLTGEQPLALLSCRGAVTVLDYEQRRHVGAQIGIDNPQGEKVGRVGRLSNRERLWLAVPEGVESA